MDRGKRSAVANLFWRIKQVEKTGSQTLQQWFSHWTRPAPRGLIAGAAADLLRSKPQLMAENALLRQQVLILRRQAKRPVLTTWDRALQVFLASRVRAGKAALVIVQPETVLR